MRLLSARPKNPDDYGRWRYGFWLFGAGLIALVILVRAIPADWEIGPFRIDANGDAANPSGLYFADDPHSPFWALVPTFNLPPRFFAARPNSSSRPVALGPTASPSDSATATPDATPSPSASPSSTPADGPTPTPAPTPTPTPRPTPSPTPNPTPTPTPTPILIAITSATESVNARHCGDGSITATGQVYTNGATGTVVYYWVRKDETGTRVTPQQPLTFSSGQTSKTITDTWAPTGAGSEQLVFVSPGYPTLTQPFVCHG